jgi:hypothetical protein
MPSRSCDTFIEGWNVIGVDCIRVFCDFGQGLQREREPEMIGSQAIVSLAQTLEQSAKININFGGPLNAVTDRLKRLVESRRQ